MSHDSRHLFYYYYYDKNGIRSFHFLEEATGQQLLDTRRWFFSLAIVESDEKKRCQIGTRFMYHKLGPRHWFDFFLLLLLLLFAGRLKGVVLVTRAMECGASPADDRQSIRRAPDGITENESISLYASSSFLYFFFFFSNTHPHTI